MKLVIITGMSGAGKSHALKTLEDLGYEAIDNIPLPFLPSLLQAGGNVGAGKLAIGTDVRTRDFSLDGFVQTLQLLKREAVECSSVFLDCEDEVLRRRFTETRRKHPLALDRPVMDGIKREREMLQPLKKHVDTIIDTTDFSGSNLRDHLARHYTSEKQMAVSLVSFSYRHGLPREADLVVDVRFLRNPHYQEALRDLSGKNYEVGEFIRADAGWEGFYSHLKQLLQPLLTRYRAEGKGYLTVAVGCTGGRHRSVFTVEMLAGFFKELGYKVDIRHRDMDEQPQGIS